MLTRTRAIARDLLCAAMIGCSIIAGGVIAAEPGSSPSVQENEASASTTNEQPPEIGTDATLAAEASLQAAEVGSLSEQPAKDQLVFRNGDRLSGAYVRQEGDFIYFHTEILGEIRVSTHDASVVHGLEAPSLPLVPLADAVVPVDSVPESEVTPSDSSASSGYIEVPTLPPGAIYRIPGAREEGFLRFILESIDAFQLIPGWKTRLTLGHVWQYGQSDQSAVNLRLSSEKRVENSYEALFDGRYNYGQQKTNGLSTKSVDHYNARFRYRRTISPSFFAQSNTRYQKDLITHIDRDAEQSIGIGWRVFQLQNTKGTITPAISGRVRAISNSPEVWTTHFALFQDFEYKFNSHIGLFQELTYSIEANDFDRFNFDGRVRLETKLTAKASLNVSWEYNYDNAVPANVLHYQHRAVTGLTMDF